MVFDALSSVFRFSSYTTAARATREEREGNFDYLPAGLAWLCREQRTAPKYTYIYRFSDAFSIAKRLGNPKYPKCKRFSLS